MRCNFIIICLTFSIFLPFDVQAEDNSKIEYRKFELRAGGFIASRNTNIKLTNEDGDGREVDLESDVGLDSTTNVGRIDGLYRFSKRHQIDFSYFSLSRDATRIIDQTLEIGNSTFEINTSLKSDSNINILKASYTYMFAVGDNYELGASLGLFMQKNRIRFETDIISKNIDEGVTLPLPAIGLKGKYDFSPRWHGIFSGETFYLTIDKFSGTLFDLRGLIEYDIYENVSLGLGYNWVYINIDIDNKIIDWSLNWRVSGVQVYLKLAF